MQPQECVPSAWKTKSLQSLRFSPPLPLPHTHTHNLKIKLAYPLTEYMILRVLLSTQRYY